MRAAPVTLPLGTLDVRTPDHMAGPGTLRRAENVVWLGSPERPILSPPEGASVAYTPTSGQEVLTAHEMPDGRVLALEPSALSVLTPGSPWTRAEAYAFGSADTTRRMQVAPVGGRYLVAVTSGAGVGAPEVTLVASETDGAISAREMKEPPPPIVVTSGTERTADDGFPPQRWTMIRVAYYYRDGTVGTPGAPTLWQPSVNTGGNLSWNLQVSLAMRTADVPTSVTYPDVAGYVVYAGFLDEAAVAGFFFGSEPEAASIPLFEVARVDDFAGFSPIIAKTPETIVAGSSMDDASLLRHGVAFGAAFAYNARAVLGDTSYSLRSIDAFGAFAGSTIANAGSDYAVRIGIVYETPDGEAEAIGKVAYSTAVAPQFNTLWGIDPRVRRFRLYTRPNGHEDFYRFDEIEAKRVPGTTLAFAFPGTPKSLNYTTAPTYPDAEQEATYRAPGEVRWTEPFALLDLPAGNVVAASETETVYGFATTGEPVSEGQFGQYPLLALLSGGVDALQLGSDPFIVGRSPLSSRVRIAGRRAWCSVPGGLALATLSGVFFVSQRIEDRPFSLPLHAQDASDDLLTAIGAGVSIGYLDSPARDRREVWVSAGSTTYVYSLDVGRWATLTRERSGYAGAERITYGITAAGALASETTGTDDAQTIAIETAPLFGDPFTKKRLRRFGIRQRPMCDSLDVVLREPPRSESGAPEGVVLVQARIVGGYDDFSFHTPGCLTYEVLCEITGTARPSQSIEGFEARVELRQRHDTRD